MKLSTTSPPLTAACGPFSSHINPEPLSQTNVSRLCRILCIRGETGRYNVLQLYIYSIISYCLILMYSTNLQIYLVFIKQVLLTSPISRGGGTVGLDLHLKKTPKWPITPLAGRYRYNMGLCSREPSTPCFVRYQA